MRDSFFKIIVVILLAINTFFLGGIWCAMKCPYGMSKGAFCPLGSKMGKICPITGKTLQAPQQPAAQ